jgi:rhamnose utilization protein RhaD (predicted bifunctional aldolase and dehydrogenase)
MRMACGPAFSGQARRAHAAAALMPTLRALMSGESPKVGHFCDGDEMLEFVCSRNFKTLPAIGTSCPDHFLCTRIAHLTFDETRLGDMAYLEKSVRGYREAYAAYYQRCAREGDPGSVTAGAVRRDLERLMSAGLSKRVRGGARYRSGARTAPHLR